MNVEVESRYEYHCDLRPQPDLAAMPLSSQRVTNSLREIIAEHITNGILAGVLPARPESVRVRISPRWKEAPLVESLEIEATAEGSTFSQIFDSGPWVRASQQRLLELREEGSLGEKQLAYRMLLATANGASSFTPPLLEPPVIEDATLAECGVRSIDEGALVPDRPVLVNRRFATDAVRMCEEADSLETGGAALGRIVRLPEPLPGAQTRITTILSAIVADPRHFGSETRFHFSPEALAEAQQMGRLRGLGERVITVFHTHGWSNRCGNCNENTACPLAESNPSLHDYDQLLAQAFTAKSTLLPIAGRKLGVQGRRPVLQVHAWRRGEMRPIRWSTYED